MSMNHLTRIPAPKDTRSPIRDELRVQISRYIGAPGFAYPFVSYVALIAPIATIV